MSDDTISPKLLDWEPNPLAKELAPREPPRLQRITLAVRPEVQKMLEDATAVLSKQLSAYRKEQDERGALSPQDVSAMSRLVDSVVKLSKEEREQRKELVPQSEEDLMKVLKEMLREGVIDVEGE